MTSARPGPAAIARGVVRYDLRSYDAHAIDVMLVGRGLALEVSATGDVTRERLGTTIELRATEDELAFDIDQASYVLAHRDDADWRVETAPPNPDALALLAAVDLDLAVQGSAIIWNHEYVQCTAECTHAAACTLRALNPRCVQALASCTGCLEQAP